MSAWDRMLAHQKDERVPSPGGEHHLQRFNNAERVVGVREEAAGQIAEIDGTGLKGYRAQDIMARLRAHAAEVGPRLNAEIISYADRYQGNQFLEDVNAAQAARLIDEAEIDRQEILRRTRTRITEVVDRPITPRQRGFWEKLFGW